MLDDLLSELSDTSLGRICRELLEIYGSLDAETGAFSSACAVRCPPGCGRCCEGFSPPVARIEADLAAVFLADTPEKHPPRGGSRPAQCPFYDASSSLHCTIHPVRPLICRGFGFTSYGGKDGGPRFSFCRHMPVDGRRRLDGDAMGRRFPRMPPRMDGFYSRVLALAHGTEAAQETLSQAMASSMGKVRAILAYARGSIPGDVGAGR